MVSSRILRGWLLGAAFIAVFAGAAPTHALPLEGVDIPQRIAGFMATGRTDYAHENEGQSVKFQSGRISADVYVFDNGFSNIPDGPRSPALEQRMIEAVAAIQAQSRAQEVSSFVLGRGAAFSCERFALANRGTDLSSVLCLRTEQIREDPHQRARRGPQLLVALDAVHRRLGRAPASRAADEEPGAMRRWPLLLIATMAAAPLPARAESCDALLDRGGRVVDSYVMDFGSRDKLWIYIVRTPAGATEKCTSARRLRVGQGRMA